MTMPDKEQPMSNDVTLSIPAAALSAAIEEATRKALLGAIGDWKVAEQIREGAARAVEDAQVVPAIVAALRSHVAAEAAGIVARVVAVSVPVVEKIMAEMLLEAGARTLVAVRLGGQYHTSAEQDTIRAQVKAELTAALAP